MLNELYPPGRILGSALCHLGVTAAPRLSIAGRERAAEGDCVVGLLGLIGLRKGNRHERAGFALYGAAVGAARDKLLYETLGVPDTLDGRFDLIAVHAFLVIHRLKALPEPGPALAQAVFDAMFSDMDISLREIGVSDLRIGKRVRAMWEAFHGRAKAYGEALEAGDEAALAAALARNVWRGAPPDGAPQALARLVVAQSAQLAGQDLAALAAGVARFLPAEEAVR
jgi:cytochrome b pre-mRNA-processing protein 3